jgi:hypothetical protein
MLPSVWSILSLVRRKVKGLLERWKFWNVQIAADAMRRWRLRLVSLLTSLFPALAQNWVLFLLHDGRNKQTWLFCCWFSFNHKQPGQLLLNLPGYVWTERIYLHNCHFPTHFHYALLGFLDSDMLLEYLKERSPIVQGLEGRISFADPEPEPPSPSPSPCQVDDLRSEAGVVVLSLGSLLFSAAVALIWIFS